MKSSYDAMRYHGSPFAQTHPDRLATMAALFGMEPPDIQNARVLEIGCCDGGNLIPMAMSLPESQFVGIDLTEADITRARETAAALGLPNISFHAMDLTNAASLGSFDYIVAHGIYSWVPPAVREALMAVTKAMLSKNGVAYISYNTFPGCHLRVMLREMMLFHTSGVEDPAEVLARSRQLLSFIASATGGDDLYHDFIRKEIEQIGSRPDYGLFHDELEENYHPVYFHQFIAHAARHGLKYLAEANYFDMRSDSLGPEAAPALAELKSEPLLREQYLDFARARRFRQTLLCHAEVDLQPEIEPDRLRALFISSPARVVSTEQDIEEFHGPHNSKIKTAHLLVRSILHCLIAAWPGAPAFSELPGAASQPAEAAGIVQAMFSAGLVEVRIRAPQFAIVPSERPLASPLARLQAAQSKPLTTLRHTVISTSGALENRLILLLDGTRTRADLLAELAPLIEAEKPREQLAAELNTSLETLGRLCLLIS